MRLPQLHPASPGGEREGDAAGARFVPEVVLPGSLPDILGLLTLVGAP